MAKNVITLIKGDDTNWNDEQSFVINLDTELDLTEGFSAEFTLGDITKKFPVIENNKIEPVLTHKETSKLDIGYLNGTLKIYDYQMRIKTIKSNIPFVVKEGVYTSNKDINANPEQLPTEEINLSIGSSTGTSDYNQLKNKPFINGVELEGFLTLDNLGIEIPELSDLVTKEELKETNERVEANSNDLTEIKADIADFNVELEAKATQEDIEKAISSIQILDTSDLVTNEELQDAIKNIPGVDLSGLATKEELETVKETADNAVPYSEFEGRKIIQLGNHDAIGGVMTNGDGANLAMISKWDVADFGSAKVHANLNTKDTVTINDKEIVATTKDIENAVNEIKLPTKVSELQNDVKYTTLEAVSEVGYLTKHQDISNLANKSELKAVEDKIPSIDGLATKVELEAVVESIPSIDNLATKIELEDVEEKIPDVSDLATKEELTQGLADKVNTDDLAEVASTGLYSDLIGAPSIPTKTSELVNDSGFLTEHQDISDLVSQEELETVENKIPTKVSQLVNDSDFLTSVPSNYVTEKELNQTIQQGNYATKTEVETVSDDLEQLSSQVGTQNEAITTLSNTKANTSSLAAVATSGSYEDLTNKPSVVTSNEITKIKKLTQDEYDALTTKDNNTFYVIVGE